MKRTRLLLLFAQSPENATLSYQRGWPRHFLKHHAFDCTPIDVQNRGLMSRLSAGWHAHAYRGDAVVVLHSVFSNVCVMPPWLADALARLRQPKVFFIGNEYKLMPEKMAFCERLHVALLISQSLSPAVHQLYRNRLGCLVTGIPNTGLDSALFHPTTPVEHRPVDLGYRAGDGPFYLGHQERRTIGEFFTDHAARYGLEVDISLRVQDRLPEDAWAAFLNRCKGQLGCEAGGDFFDLNDAVRRRTLAYEASHPGASFDEVFDHCLRDEPDTIPLRILSGRHIEAAGTGTAQLLFEGHYDGCLVADEHYIPLKKDFSNAADAVAKFRDTGFRQRIVANALHLARDQFTYERLLDRFQAALAPVL